MQRNRTLASLFRAGEHKARQAAFKIVPQVARDWLLQGCELPAMTTATISSSAPPAPGGRSLQSIVEWLGELEECRVGGLISDEDYAIERAEKLSELLCRHRRLWLASVSAAGSMASFAGCAVWSAAGEWQITTVAAGLGALFGVAMLASPFREILKQTQIRERLTILNALLARDLITPDEFLVYEERLESGDEKLMGI